jgi:voltage-gated potassium channel
MHEEGKTELSKVGFLDLYCGFVGAYSLILLSISLFATPNAEQLKLSGWLDLSICVLFIVELVHRFRKTGKEGGFWKKSWIDLVSCVPFVPWLRPLRAVSLLFIFVRMYRTSGPVLNPLKGRRTSAPALAFFLFYSIMLICSPLIMLAERNSPGATILKAGDAVWWVFETVSTVGYGDLYPETVFGRIVGAATMIFGVGMFGAITATVLSVFGLNPGGGSESAETKALREENERLKTLCANASRTSTPAKNAGNDCNLA